MKVLAITSQWPTQENPSAVPFLVREVEALRHLGVEIDVFHFKGGFRPANYYRANRNLIKQLSLKDYDLLHGHFGVGGLPAFLLKQYPLVISFRGSDLNGMYDLAGNMTLAGRFLRMVSQLVALRASEAILVSESMQQHLPRKDFHIIPSGLDLDLFKPLPKQEARQLLGLSANHQYVLFAGGINNPVKRYPLATQAIELAQSRFPNLKLLLANQVAPAKMPTYLSAADALILTSISEGSPNIVKEALACNCPVASVKVGDVPRLLQDLNGCYLSDDDSPKALAEALINVLEYAGDIKTRERVLTLSSHHTAQKIFDVYQKALTQKAST